MLRNCILAQLCLLMLYIAACDKSGEMELVRFLPVTGIGSSAQPHLAGTTDDGAVLSWLQETDDKAELLFSTWDGAGWNEPRSIASGDDWFINWADFPSVMPVDEQFWAAHWLRKRSGGRYAYDVVVALSTDAGETWGEPQVPHDDGTATEHGFVSLFPWDGKAAAVWLDGREMTGASESHSGHHDGGMTLRSATLTVADGVTNPQLIDSLVCDCCQTDVALTDVGPVLVYRNRTVDEVRDIYVASANNESWTTPQAVADDGWEISGCPVNGPAIAAFGNQVVVAWFTAAADHPRVRVAWSHDSGVTFGEPIDIDADNPVGRVDVEIDAGDAVVSWLRKGDEGTGEICLRRVGHNGSLGEPHVIAKTSAARMSGFPQLLAVPEGLLLAWTDVAGSEKRVKSALIDPRQVD